MPLLFSIVAALELASAPLPQVQEPTFDVQLAIPSDSSKKNPVSNLIQSANSTSNATSGSVAPSQTAVGQFRFMAVDPPASTYSQANSSQKPSPEMQALIGRANELIAETRAMGQTPNTQIQPRDKTGRLRQTPRYIQISPRPSPTKLPNGRMWTWDSQQIPDFDRASKEFRNSLKPKPGFGNMNGNEFKYYATPLFPEKQNFTFKPMTVNPKFQGNSPKLQYRITNRSSSLIDSLTQRQKQLQKTRGFLHFNELTPAQQKLLTHPQGQFEIDYQSKDKEVKIKN